MYFVEVPKWLIRMYNKVFIVVNVLLVKSMHFMVSGSSNIKYNTVQDLENRKKATIIGWIDAIIAQYSK